MKQIDIKKGKYYSNGKTVRVVTGIDSIFPEMAIWVWYRMSEGSFQQTQACRLKTFAKWSKKMVAPVWVDAQSCPNCEGACDQVTALGSLDNHVDLECPECGHVRGQW